MERVNVAEFLAKTENKTQAVVALVAALESQVKPMMYNTGVRKLTNELTTTPEVGYTMPQGFDAAMVLDAGEAVSGQLFANNTRVLAPECEITVQVYLDSDGCISPEMVVTALASAEEADYQTLVAATAGRETAPLILGVRLPPQLISTQKPDGTFCVTAFELVSMALPYKKGDA